MKNSYFYILIIIQLLCFSNISHTQEIQAEQSNTNNNSPTQQESDLSFSANWVKPAQATQNTAAYITINNQSNKTYNLIGATAADLANNTELHHSYVDESGVARMQAIDNVVIPPNSKITMEPGGLHIMLLNLKKDLPLDSKVVVTLKFKEITPQDVTVEVKSSNTNSSPATNSN